MYVLLRRWVAWAPGRLRRRPPLRVLALRAGQPDRRPPDAGHGGRAPAGRPLPRRAPGPPALAAGGSTGLAIGALACRAVLRRHRAAGPDLAIAAVHRGRRWSSPAAPAPSRRRCVARRPLRAGGRPRPRPVRSAVLLAWPAWFALAGPGPPVGQHLGEPAAQLRRHVRPLVRPPDAGRRPGSLALTHQVGGYQAPTLSGQYLGVGLLAVLVVGLVVWRRDLRLWLFAAVGVVCRLALARARVPPLDARGASWCDCPLMDNVIPSRFVLVTYLCAAAMLGDRRRPHSAAGGRRPAGRGRTGARTVLAAGAPAWRWRRSPWCPVVAYFADGLPLTAVPVEPPEWFTTVAPDLPPGQVLLVFPFAFRAEQHDLAGRGRHAVRHGRRRGPELAAQPGRARGGGRPLPRPSSRSPAAPRTSWPGRCAAVRHALDGWGVTGIVLPDPQGLPDYEQMHAVRATVVLLTAATGQAPEYRAGAWVWTGVDRAPAALEPRSRSWRRARPDRPTGIGGVDPGLGRLRPRRAAGRLTRAVRRGPVSCGVRRTGPSRGELHAVSGEQQRNRDRPDAAGTRP